MLSQDEVKKLGELARIDLSPAEVAKFQQDLSAVLEYVEELKKVDTAGILELAQVTGLENVFRQDEVDKLAPVEDLFTNTPEVKDGYVQVKAIL